ncbi:MAG: methionyl-tRNA formyltransferase, partial [Gammaproteobacteria bacterium]|nr:methionyl-tRNA formyltransferase [Gammaproteobacteria bacterium]
MPLKIAFFGTPPYAVPTLDALVAAGHEIVSVVAQPDRRSGRGKKLQSPPTIVRARELGLTTRQPRAVRSGTFYNNYLALDIDVAVVVAYGRILPLEIINYPKYGSLNAHGSLLPRWRGAAPIERAILSGDKVTGVSIMQMDEGLDTGDVLMIGETQIGPDETSLDLRRRMSTMSAEMVVHVLSQI